MIILLTLIICISNLGCIFNDDHGWIQSYRSTYNQILNSTKIIQKFNENDIHNNYTVRVIDNKIHKEVIIFSFGKGINNESIESSHGSIYIWLIADFPEKYPDGHTNLNVWLDRTKYRPVKNKDELSHQKPLLVNSFEYIEKIIYDATGQRPASKNISIGDTD